MQAGAGGGSVGRELHLPLATALLQNASTGGDTVGWNKTLVTKQAIATDWRFSVARPPLRWRWIEELGAWAVPQLATQSTPLTAGSGQGPGSMTLHTRASQRR